MSQLFEVMSRFSPDARIDHIEPLVGGVSASVNAVTFTRPDGMQERVVVKQPRKHAWKVSADSQAELEYRLLIQLRKQGLPMPRPLHLDPIGFLVLEFLEGTHELPDNFPSSMARMLAQIHATNLSTLIDLPLREEPVPHLLEWMGSEIVAGLSRFGAFEAQPRLLHGDFWQGNLIWRGSEIAAVLDWEDAAVGDPLSDVACTRVELACAVSEEEVSSFTSSYFQTTAMDPRRLPLWDLYVSTAALNSMEHWGLKPEVLASRRKATERFQLVAKEAVTAAKEDIRS